MNQLIRHLLLENPEQILARSLKNCHVKGLHSIMLRERAGETLRLYIATEQHELYLDDTNLNLAYHPHHCNISIDVIQGWVYNKTVEVNPQGHLILDRYLYNSEITRGKIGFQLLQPKDRLKEIDNEYLRRGDGVYLKASDIHIVHLSQGYSASWLVYEGKEDRSYQPFCWSNKDLENLDTTGLYQKFENFEEILNLAL
jgi:hypothetical protein